jgi:hypothetical protein
MSNWFHECSHLRLELSKAEARIAELIRGEVQCQMRTKYEQSIADLRAKRRSSVCVICDIRYGRYQCQGCGICICDNDMLLMYCESCPLCDSQDIPRFLVN